MCLLVFSLFISQNFISVQAETKIDAKIVITKENLNDVLKYLNINPKDCIINNNIESSDITVGQVEKEIKKYKEISKTNSKAIIDNKNNNISSDLLIQSNIVTTSPLFNPSILISSTKNFYKTDHIGDCEKTYELNCYIWIVYWTMDKGK